MLRQIINSCFCTRLSPRGRKRCVFPSLFPSSYPSPGSSALWFCVALGDPRERLAINSKTAFKLYSFALCWGSRLFHSGALNSWFISQHNLSYTLQWSWSPPDKLQPDGTVFWGCLCFVPINYGKACRVVQEFQWLHRCHSIDANLLCWRESKYFSREGFFYSFSFSDFRNTWIEYLVLNYLPWVFAKEHLICVKREREKKRDFALF